MADRFEAAVRTPCPPTRTHSAVLPYQFATQETGRSPESIGLGGTVCFDPTVTGQERGGIPTAQNTTVTVRVAVSIW
jgi:hypothetical protein